jgi:hypothetical protein
MVEIFSSPSLENPDVIDAAIRESALADRSEVEAMYSF